MSSTPASAPASRFPFGKVVLGFLAGIALVFAFGVGALLAYQGQYAERIYPGVTVDGVDVSGLGRDEAAARLENALSRYADGTVVLAIDGSEVRVPYSTLGRRPDVEALVELAWSVGRSEADVIARTAQGVRTLLDGTRIGPLVAVDPAAVDREVTRIALATNRAPQSGTAEISEGGFATQPAVPGKVLSHDEVAAAIEAALNDPAAPANVELSFETTAIEPFIHDGEVAAAIEAATRMAQPVVLKHGDEKWTIGAGTVRSWLRFETTTDGYAPTIPTSGITKSLKSLAKKIDSEPREASFALKAGDRIVAVAGKNGRSLDVKATTALVAAEVAGRAESTAAPTPVAPALKVVEPELTTAEARKLAPRMRKISSWTTYYEVSERNGFSNNISIPARDLDGVVVNPGDTFDFWDRIGPVTAARGYRNGGAIINGKSQPTGAFAGGICSTSTTLFNAVARAGYRMLARHNHYYYITRYPTGLDATVAIEGNSVTTMSWKNDSDYPVMIRSYARPGVVQFSIYTVAVNDRPAVGGGSAVPGSTNVTYHVANGRTVVFRTSPKRNYNAATSSAPRTTSLPAGTVKVVEYPTDGFDITVTRTVRKGGKVILSNTWISHYARVDGLTLIGVR